MNTATAGLELRRDVQTLHASDTCDGDKGVLGVHTSYESPRAEVWHAVMPFGHSAGLALRFRASSFRVRLLRAPDGEDAEKVSQSCERFS